MAGTPAIPQAKAPPAAAPERIQPDSAVRARIVLQQGGGGGPFAAWSQDDRFVVIYQALTNSVQVWSTQSGDLVNKIALPQLDPKGLLEAWQLAAASGRLAGWRLQFVGPVKVSEGGGGEEWLTALRKKFPAAGVEWHAPIYDAVELNRVYELATVFAYPSLARKGETFGVAPLEAMAWGAIPVVSGLACFRDFITDGRNGFVFDHTSPAPAAALAGALTKAAHGESRVIAERAVGVRESHSGREIATQFLADFSRLTTGGPIKGRE